MAEKKHITPFRKFSPKDSFLYFDILVLVQFFLQLGVDSLGNQSNHGDQLHTLSRQKTDCFTPLPPSTQPHLMRFCLFLLWKGHSKDLGLLLESYHVRVLDKTGLRFIKMALIFYLPSRSAQLPVFQGILLNFFLVLKFKNGTV